MRARYWLLPAVAAFLFAGSSAASLLPRQTVGADANTVEVADAADTQEQQLIVTDPEEKRLLTQKRLQRYAQYDDLRDAPTAVAAPPPQERPEPREKTIVIGRGDTLGGVLQEAGLDGNSAHLAVEAVKDIFDPRDIHPGQKVSVQLSPSQEGISLAAMNMDIDALRTLHLARTPDGSFNAAVDEKKTVRRQYAKQADIELSLYGSALKAGMPATVIADAIKAYSWDVDFQRDIRQGDVLEAMYDQVETEDGTPVQTGDLVYARLNVNGQDMPLYRYETADGRVDYYTPDGTSIKKALLSTPVDGARLSSGFGMREHPVLGYTKMHKGVDFAAATGTPIYAAGDGVVEKAGKWSTYGNYVRIRHNASTKTAYAHMKGFAKGISAGSRVKQGQIIGYIGTTGRSTGPHLHYEVLVNGTQVNPRNVKMQRGDSLRGKQLAAFRLHVETINRQYAALSGAMKMASADAGDQPDFR